MGWCQQGLFHGPTHWLTSFLFVGLARASKQTPWLASGFHGSEAQEQVSVVTGAWPVLKVEQEMGKDLLGPETEYLRVLPAPKSEVGLGSPER